MPGPANHLDLRNAASRVRPSGFTLVELLVTLGIIALLMGLIISAVTKVRASAQSAKCLANLRQIGNAFHIYVANSGGRLPDPLGDEIPWEATLRGCIQGEKVFQCPADEEVFPSVGSSYDWRDTGDPATSIAGRAPDEARGDAVLAFESLPGWHARRKINVVRMNGSAESVDDQDCFADLSRPVQVGQ